MTPEHQTEPLSGWNARLDCNATWNASALQLLNFLIGCVDVAGYSVPLLQCRLTGHCTMMPLSTYVSSHQSPTSRFPTRQRLRSSTSDDLCVPAVRLPTVGRRAFSVAGARVWNALPVDVTSAPSLFTFRKRLKLHLFSLSYPGLVY